MRISRIFDGEGSFDIPADYGMPREDQQTPTAPAGSPTPSAPSAPAEPPPATGGQTPGPTTPSRPPTGNPAPPMPPVPPAVPSAVQGIKESQATGGVQGSFAQAGSAGLSKRFGSPAAWFRGAGDPNQRAAVQALGADLANRGRTVLGKGSAGASSGGSVVPVNNGPSLDAVADDKQNIDWQRLIQEVMKQRFGG